MSHKMSNYTCTCRYIGIMGIFPKFISQILPIIRPEMSRFLGRIHTSFLFLWFVKTSNDGLSSWTTGWVSLQVVWESPQWRKTECVCSATEHQVTDSEVSLQWVCASLVPRPPQAFNRVFKPGNDATLLRMGRYSSTTMCQYWYNRLIYWAVYRLFYWHVPIMTHSCATVTTHF